MRTIKSNVLIIAAPFGFVPAAKALIIGATLSDIAHFTFIADGDAAGLIERHKLSEASCVKGRFSQIFADHQSLEKFDRIISVSHDPAIHHLGRLGLAGAGYLSTACLLGALIARHLRCRKVCLLTWWRTIWEPVPCSRAARLARSS